MIEENFNNIHKALQFEEISKFVENKQVVILVGKNHHIKGRTILPAGFYRVFFGFWRRRRSRYQIDGAASLLATTSIVLVDLVGITFFEVM